MHGDQVITRTGLTIKAVRNSVEATTIGNKQVTLMPGACDARVRCRGEQVTIVSIKIVANEIPSNAVILTERYQQKRCGR